MERKKDLHVTTRKSATSGKFQADLEPAETLGLDAFASLGRGCRRTFAQSVRVVKL